MGFGNNYLNIQNGLYEKWSRVTWTMESPESMDFHVQKPSFQEGL